eukprot:Skav233558  [mRNA]  locus=scaffold563:532727:533524:+ [translate_table: standard]
MRPQSQAGKGDSPALCRQAEYWHRRYHDVKAELCSLRERCTFLDEGRHSAIVAAVAPLRDQLGTTRLLLAEREDTVQGLLQQLKCKEDEVKRLNHELLRQTEERKVAELSCAEARNSLEAAVVKCRGKEDDCKLLLGQLEKAKDDLNQADLELNKLRMTSQPEVHCEAWELRGHLEAVLDKEARNSRMVNLLQAERDMWFSRSEHYEKNYDSLRRNLYDLASPEILEISIPSPTGRPSIVPVPPRRLFYPRRFGRRTAGDATLDT